MNPAEYMTPEQRMRRAAEILWGGIARWRIAVLDGMPQHPSVQPPDISVTSDAPLPGAVTPEHILAFLNKVGSASPKEVAHHFCISQSSAFRRLKTLLLTGRVHRNGQTNALRYSPTMQKTLETTPPRSVASQDSAE